MLNYPPDPYAAKINADAFTNRMKEGNPISQNRVGGSLDSSREIPNLIRVLHNSNETIIDRLNKLISELAPIMAPDSPQTSDCEQAEQEPCTQMGAELATMLNVQRLTLRRLENLLERLRL